MRYGTLDGFSTLSVDNCKTGLIISFENVAICVLFVHSNISFMIIVAEHVCECV